MGAFMLPIFKAVAIAVATQVVVQAITPKAPAMPEPPKLLEGPTVSEAPEVVSELSSADITAQERADKRRRASAETQLVNLTEDEEDTGNDNSLNVLGE